MSEPTPAGTVAPLGGAAPDLGRIGWDDRSMFRAGLAASQQSVLSKLPGAPVYHIALTVTASLDALTDHDVIRHTNQTGAPRRPGYASFEGVKHSSGVDLGTNSDQPASIKM